MKNIFFYDIEYGRLAICEDGNKITNICFEKDIEVEGKRLCETQLIKETFEKIKSYLAGELIELNVPIEMTGTDFQKSVWKELMKIPYGETRSYKDIAEALDRTTAFRAVGNANGKNMLLFIVPCHRVICSNGSLGGFAAGADVKKRLLEMERKNI